MRIRRVKQLGSSDPQASVLVPIMYVALQDIRQLIEKNKDDVSLVLVNIMNITEQGRASMPMVRILLSNFLDTEDSR